MYGSSKKLCSFILLADADLTGLLLTVRADDVVSRCELQLTDSKTLGGSVV